MARTTHVKKAQQRYETVIVRDDEGNPLRTPVMVTKHNYDTGQDELVQKVTKKGRLVFMTVTAPDKSKPLPPYECDACRQPIEVGTPYKHITPKSGPYGGRKRTRHESCPSWQVWDYSNSLSAQLARVAYDFSNEIDNAESPDDIQTALDDAASSIEEIADQKQESADNIESGFGHATSASEELAEQADSLRDWAGEITSADIPDMVECAECTDGETDCDECSGSGQVTDDDGEDEDCEECQATGTVECSNCDASGEDIAAWRDEVRDSVTIVDESPV
jgi:hypothetical protein